MGQQEIHWRAKEYVFHKKSVDWYWYFGLVVVCLIAFSIYVDNILFAFVVGIGAFTMILNATKIPDTVNYTATSRGIKTGKIQYPYSTLDSFWLNIPKEESGEKILLLRSQKISMPMIVIPLGDADIDELHGFLLNFLEEKESSLPLGQIFMNLIGF
ncbi:MAG: hypothetical protein WC878_00700 [Candidatus Paceibacterota bacterium]|jgi:hypothetical protein